MCDLCHDAMREKGLIMSDLVELGLTFVDEYCCKDIFKRIVCISNDISGAADFISLVAYPLKKDDKHRVRFRDAMLNAALNGYCKRKSICKNEKSKLIRQLGIQKPLIWRDIDSAITGGTKKLGGGTKKLTERFHAYHVFRAYDNALADDAGLSFRHVLEHISTAYESNHLKVSDIESRIHSFKRTFRQSRPVLHLTYGLVESFKSKGWTNEYGQLCYGVKPAILDPSWLPEAIEISKVVLGLQLAEHEQGNLKGQQLRGHKFDPKEIVYLYF